MKKYALACDLDGTLIKHNNGIQNPRSVLTKDIQRIQKFVEQGNLFIVSTGRICPLTFALFDEIGFHPSNTYYIASNGAEIYDQDRNQIYNLHISYKQTINVFKQFQHFVQLHPLLFQVYDGLNNYCLHQQDELPLIQHALSICIESTTQDIAQIKQIYQQLQTTLHQCEVSMNNWFINVVPKNVSKASAIQYILSLQHAPYTVYAIGDSYNDTVMFSIADESYTFLTSPDDVKQKAKHYVEHVYQCIDEMV